MLLKGYLVYFLFFVLQCGAIFENRLTFSVLPDLVVNRCNMHDAWWWLELDFVSMEQVVFCILPHCCELKCCSDICFALLGCLNSLLPIWSNMSRPYRWLRVQLSCPGLWRGVMWFWKVRKDVILGLCCTWWQMVLDVNLEILSDFVMTVTG